VQKALKLHGAEVLKDNEKILEDLSQEQLKDCFLQEASLKKEEEDSSVDSDSDGHDDDDDVQIVKIILQESSRYQILMTPHQVVVVIQMT
jgi:hypothetical protein